MERFSSIHDIARMTGISSRTLRHYDSIGLLAPSHVGPNGYRSYDQAALVRLQRILLLRRLGLGLKAIGEILAHETNEVDALRAHLDWLRAERDRISRQIDSVERTVRAMQEGSNLMANEMFDGFDHTRYKDEVVARWGKDAYDSGDRWWRSLTKAQQQAIADEQARIAADFGQAHLAGLPVESDAVQAIVQRQHDWLSHTTTIGKEYFVGLAEMYVTDPRFTANYDKHGEGTAVFIRDAMKIYADRNL
jgi:DNA-binding transcriptional MerR regulator